MIITKICYESNPHGPTLGFCEGSGVSILKKDGLLFKNLSRTGELLEYEDWRLSPEQRARDLLKRLSLEQLAGMMMHRLSPTSEQALADEELEASYIHSFAIMDSGDSVQQKCASSNAIQSRMESLPLGIPALLTAEGINLSDDSGDGRVLYPDADLAVLPVTDADVYSKWPAPLGIASTFDPKYAGAWGEAAAREYRATGVTVALEPQIDIATEPRWMRFYQTFGEGTRLTTDMGRAFIDGLQTSSAAAEITGGWGYESVCATAKHFPGGATGEGGRDAHFNYGKYAVYPGNNFEEHLKPFVEGALKLDSPTSCAAYVMPYYTVSYAQDTLNGENVGNGFSSYMLKKLLRERFGYSGGIFSDFAISPPPANATFDTGRCWGLEEYSEEAKRLKGLLAGICVYGADDNVSAMRRAVDIALERYGEDMTRKILESAVYYHLLNSCRQGLFENPYLDAEASGAVLPAEDALLKGYEAQQKSVILLKNTASVLPVRERKTVYVPKRSRSSRAGAVDLRFATQAAGKAGSEYLPVSKEIIERYYDLTEDPAKADFAIVFIESPDSGGGWSREDKKLGGNGYVPVSLQYRPYTAEFARETSLAGGDIFEDFTNRSYKNKSVVTYNESDLDAVLETRKVMGGKPVVVSLLFSRPCVTGEFEPFCDAIVAHCGLQTSAILDIISGAVEPSGLLPCQMPASMKTVELQMEDVPFDMECHRDSDGNIYDYAFGLNWAGKIEDWRTEKYARPV